MLKNDSSSPCLGIEVRDPCQLPVALCSCLAPLMVKLSVSPSLPLPFSRLSFPPFHLLSYHILPLLPSPPCFHSSLSLFPFFFFVFLIPQLFSFLPPVFSFFSLLISTCNWNVRSYCLSDECRLLQNEDGDARGASGLVTCVPCHLHSHTAPILPQEHLFL